MLYERLVAINVTDDAGYQAYRDAMTPILKTYGGGFSNDFRISEVLKTESEHPVNRIFTIYFESKSASDAFFSDENYLKVRKAHFESSTNGVTELAGYNRD